MMLAWERHSITMAAKFNGGGIITRLSQTYWFFISRKPWLTERLALKIVTFMKLMECRKTKRNKRNAEGANSYENKEIKRIPLDKWGRTYRDSRIWSNIFIGAMGEAFHINDKAVRFICCVMKAVYMIGNWDFLGTHFFF